MAYVVWVGTTAVWATAGNWTPAAAPVDGESVAFTGAVAQSVDGSTLGAGANDFAAVSFAEDMTHDVGSSGTPVTGGDITKLIFASRSGRAYWTVPNGDTMALVQYIASSGRQDALTLAVAGTGAITTIRVENASGGIVINSAALTTLEVSNSPNATVTIASAVTAINLIRINGGGTVDNSATVSTGTSPRVIINGGRYIRRSTGTISFLEMDGHGQKSILQDFASGAITAGYVAGPGVLIDGRANRNTAVTTSTLTAKNRAQVLVDNGMNAYSTLTVTSDGTATVDQGPTIAYT